MSTSSDSDSDSDSDFDSDSDDAEQHYYTHIAQVTVQVIRIEWMHTYVHDRTLSEGYSPWYGEN